MTSLLNFSLKSAFLLITLSLALLMATTVFAQTPQDLAAKYGVTFPISELGECTDLSQCRTYCEDPINHHKCVEFAKEKGFYQEDPLEKDIQAVLAAASSQLGCNSYNSCQTFCNDPANFEKCSAFAKKHNLGGGHVNNPNEEQFLIKAKEFLGCDSASSCMAFCENEANFSKCSDFAKMMGFTGGQTQTGPGGCTTPQTCEAYCNNSQHFKECSQFSTGDEFRGPGGCNDEASCRAYCEKNQLKCVSEGPAAEFCLKNPAKCPEGVSFDQFCQENPIACPKPDTTDYCHANPDQCPPEGANLDEWCQSHPDKCTYTSGPTTTVSPEEWCRQNPEKCTTSTEPIQNPDEYCLKYPDRCTGYKSQEEYASDCLNQGGTWADNSCLLPPQPVENNYSPVPQPGDYDPSQDCIKAGYNWKDNYCEVIEKGVQGVNTKRNLFERVFYFLVTTFNSN